MDDLPQILTRITDALAAAAHVLSEFTPGQTPFSSKGDAGPVTEADRLVNETLREILATDDETGWLSEESADTAHRLDKRRVWVVDPLDGTREFVDGIPEWCVSIGLVEDGRAIAGGVSNPVTCEMIVGARGKGVTYNGEPVQASPRSTIEGALVLASRTEVARGEWERFRGAPFTVRATGSVAYKLALVAAGKADATWTLTPKNEWDVVAGIALVQAATGFVELTDGSPLLLNRPSPLIPGLIAGGQSLRPEIVKFLQPWLKRKL